MTTRQQEDAAWQGLVFRPLQAEDLEQAWGLSQAAKWPHRLEDWRFALAVGQGQAVLDGGKLIGVALSWDFGACATLGLIIVSETHRGRRIASRLVADGLGAVSAPAALLHATPEGAGVYARQGFVPVGQIHQHQGIVAGLAPTPLPAGCALRKATPADLDVLEDLDRRASGLSRRAVLQRLLGESEAVILTKGERALGFSFLRRFGRGELVGPVVAPDADAARALISHWLAARAGAFVRFDTMAEEELGAWLAAAGLARVDTGMRMIRGPAPAQDPAVHTYGLVTQAMA